jgi:Cof subfamily protein (haloacid dehalogenase superfamily)
MHSKKYVFVDIDGTLVDHSSNGIYESTKKAISQAQQNGHEVLICTGRPPCLLNGIDKELGIHSYIAANGRIVVYHDQVIFSDTIDKKVIKEVVEYFNERKIDIALEGKEHYVLQTQYDTIYKQFCDNFHIPYPSLHKDFYKNNDIYQLNVFYDKPDYTRFNEIFDGVHFAFSCKYGLDVNTVGGLKEVGIKVIEEKFNVPKEDIIAIGDGHNDITMFNYVETSVAMGNAHKDVQKEATYVTNHINQDGLYNAFKMLKLI